MQDEGDESFGAALRDNVEVPMSVEQEQEVVRVEKITPEQQQRLDAEEAQKWLNDPVMKDKALLLAKQVQVVMGKNWFTLQAAQRKSGEGRQAVFAKLSMCGQFGFMAKRQSKDGVLFKVTLSHEEKIKILEFFVNEHESQLKGLRHEIGKLKALQAKDHELSVKM